jgi:hypothetical protein
MKRATLIGPLLAAMIPGVSVAEFNYNHAQIALIDVEIDGGPDVDGDGFEISGAYELNDLLFVLGKWQDQSLDFGIDGRVLEFGAGIRHEINPDLDLVGTLSYIDMELDLGPASADDDGLALSGGIRSRVADSVEIDALLRYVDFDDSGGDTGIVVTGRFYFTDTMAVSVGADMNDNADTLSVGFRVEF